MKKRILLFKEYFLYSINFQKILLWIQSELLKSDEEKRLSTLNKALFIQGGTGIGKTTFLWKVIDPLFSIAPVFFDSNY